MPRFIARFSNSGKSFWALFDQAIVSAGNFATSLLLARNLPASEFGTFVLLNAAYQVLFGLQGNLIVSPYTVLAAAGDREKARAQLTSALLVSGALAGPFSIVILIAAASLHRLDTGWYALLYLVLWQLQETTRRALSSTFRYKECLPGDFISYVGQAALLALLFSRTKISLNTTFLVMSTTSAVAMLVQMLQAGVSPVRWNDIAEHSRQFWKLGKWLAVVSMTTIATAPISAWLLNLFRGKTEAALFQAVMNVVGIANPVIVGLPSLVIPLIAQRFSTNGGGTASWAVSQSMRFTLKFWLFLSPLYLFLLALPQTALHLFYGATSIYSHEETGLRIAVLVSIATIPLTVYNAVLTGMGLTRENASTNGIGAIVSVVLTPPFAYFSGSTGVLIAECASRTVRAVWAFLRLKAAKAKLEEV